MIDVLPLGFDETIFMPGRQSLADTEGFILGFFGRLVPEKGVTDAVEVLARLDVGRPTKLVIVGDGPERPRVAQAAAALGVSGRVDVFPWRGADEPASQYRRCHVVLVPSKPTLTWVEQFGRVIVEAQACGAVVAAYASGAIPEVAGPAALLVEPGDVRGLAAQVSSLLESSSRFAEHQAIGFGLAQQRGWERVAAQQVRLLELAADGCAHRLPLPLSPAARRAAAHAEFGTPAATPAGSRPFALPVLRHGGAVALALSRVVDTGAKLAAGQWRGRTARWQRWGR